ncbi:hypothetical protein ABPG74_001589 [Tetrahymena malaccensis]
MSSCIRIDNSYRQIRLQRHYIKSSAVTLRHNCNFNFPFLRNFIAVQHQISPIIWTFIFLFCKASKGESPFSNQNQFFKLFASNLNSSLMASFIEYRESQLNILIHYAKFENHLPFLVMIVQVYVNIGMKRLNMIIINLEWLMGKSNLHHENSTLGFGVLVYYFYSLQILNQFNLYYYTGMSSVELSDISQSIIAQSLIIFNFSSPAQKQTKKVFLKEVQVRQFVFGGLKKQLRKQVGQVTKQRVTKDIAKDELLIYQLFTMSQNAIIIF